MDGLVQAFTHTPMQERMRACLQDPGAIAALIENNVFVQKRLGAEAAGFIKAQLQELKRLKQEQEDKDTQGVELSFYLCDHLGTPNALVDRQGNIIWAAVLDAWGNVLEEFSPSGMEQAIRLPGQHQDREMGLLYNRHRYYDPSIGTYINQDPIGLMGGINKYTYPLDSLSLFDPLGLWASKYGFYVHQRAGYLVFGKELTPAERVTVARGHVFADSPQFQDISTSHRHAMRQPKESVSSACAKANNFVRSQFSKAWQAKSRGDRSQALHEFAVGLHTLQDATSSSHSGFQIWDGHITAGHIIDDTKLLDPSRDSDLTKATQDAWNWFNSGKLPEGNLFRCSCE